ncbi:hypothetical protein LCGC14_1990240, partial [marine sediment metagenome]
AIGIAGGTTIAAATDHGLLDGLGDTSDHAWALLVDGSRAGSTGAAQSFGSTGIKADVIAEDSAAAGVTIDGVLLKDFGVKATGTVVTLETLDNDAVGTWLFKAWDGAAQQTAFAIVSGATPFAKLWAPLDANSKKVINLAAPTDANDAARKTDLHAQAHAAAQHDAAVLIAGANENLGAFYLDIDDIAVPANPGAGIRRLFTDTATGELSVRTSAGATVSLEAAGGGGGDSIEDADSNTKVQTEESADENKIRFDVAGNERFVIQDSSLHFTMDGELDMTYNDSNIGQITNIRIRPTITACRSWQGVNINPTLTLSGDGRVIVGVFGAAVVKAIDTNFAEEAYGLKFSVSAQLLVASASATFSKVHGTNVNIQALAMGSGTTETVTEMHGCHISFDGYEYSGGAVVVDVLRGIYIGAVTNQAGTPTWTLYEGLAIEDTTVATTCRLLEIGGATPYLRVPGNVSAVSRETALYLSWGTAVPAWSLKQLKTVLESSLDTGAGTKEICYLA